jgi:mono/diheme cytochrome c family protein
MEAQRVISGTSVVKVGRRLAWMPALLPALVLLSGCEPDPYPSSMEYPARTDILVLEVGSEEPYTTFGPGQLYPHLDSIRDKPGFKVVDPVNLDRDKRVDIAETLAKLFGSPADPTVPAPTPADRDNRKALELDADTLAYGSKLYRRHCLHCHGVSGDGRGPTAPWVNPPPRDYRQGGVGEHQKVPFKFTSVVFTKKARPSRADLLRTLTEGIEGTAMPSFKTLPHKELEALVSYVIHLSLRGSVEFDALEQVSTKSDESKDIAGYVTSRAAEALSEWRYNSIPISEENSDPEKKLQPYPYGSDDTSKEFKDSVRAGYTLFLGDGGCVKCHVDFGRQAKFRYDEWGTLVRPNNLTQGIYRGGRRPIDLYFRIHSGIDPSTMPGATPEIAKDPKKMWALVNFVRALPYPEMLPEDVKKKIYGPSR